MNNVKRELSKATEDRVWEISQNYYVMIHDLWFSLTQNLNLQRECIRLELQEFFVVDSDG